MPPSHAAIAVLASGGLDSAVLLAELAREYKRVFPVYIRAGHIWESAELFHLQRFLAEVRRPALQPLAILDLPVADLYAEHWSLTGRGVPGPDSPDEAVYLPGRNLLLASKALVWCCLRGVPTLALGTLQGNPFPDADEPFFESLAALASRALGTELRLIRPFTTLSKRDVLARGRDLPLRWTLSCIQPVDTLHCGQCNKCAERHRAFADLGLDDPTEYSLFLKDRDHVPRYA